MRHYRGGTCLLVAGLMIVTAETRATERPPDVLQLHETSLSFLRAPISVSAYGPTESLVAARDTEVLDALEQTDGRNPINKKGWTRASRIQLLLVKLRLCQRRSINLTSHERRRFIAALKMLGVDDDLDAVWAAKSSRQSIPTRQLLSFLFDGSDVWKRPLREEDRDNVFRAVVKRRSELNAEIIRDAYDIAMPLLQLSFDRFCSTAAAHAPRVNDGQVLGSFDFDPVRSAWEKNDGWMTVERQWPDTSTVKLFGEIKRVAVEMPPPISALIYFLDTSLHEPGKILMVNSPSGLESISIERIQATELLELLRSIPSALYIGRNFHSSQPLPPDNPFQVLTSTSGTFIFATEYAR